MNKFKAELSKEFFLKTVMDILKDRPEIAEEDRLTTDGYIDFGYLLATRTLLVSYGSFYDLHQDPLYIEVMSFIEDMIDRHCH